MITRGKKNVRNRKQVGKLTNVKPILSVITLNINGLNILISSHIWGKWSQEKETTWSNHVLSEETCFIFKDKIFKSKRMRTNISSNNKKKAVVDILVSYKIKLRWKLLEETLL